ncbi:Outer membrane lipoprotein-sorting protein [Tenacibaculum sp. 190524A02b]|uniref:Outer membrane lipoprotein-sorting protein n=1 Tax=Tenacibaculum vairaonense TaxID=3137860 RepID=A0ABP1FEF6_9FLAO
MKKIISILILIITLPIAGQNKAITASQILTKVDGNLVSKQRIIQSQMIIYGKRKNRTIVSKGYSKGNEKSFIEYLQPKRERGTKMLKLKNRLWIYSPSSDRTIQLSGHLLRQSVMGSDLSYEDVSSNEKYSVLYHSKLIGEEAFKERKTWVIELVAKNDEVNYQKRKLWVDQERFIPLKEEMYAKSGQKLKEIKVLDVMKIKSKWYPKVTNYKDVLKDGKGTDFIIDTMDLEANISEDIFNKASLKK